MGMITDVAHTPILGGGGRDIKYCFFLLFGVCVCLCVCVHVLMFMWNLVADSRYLTHFLFNSYIGTGTLN